MRKLTPLILLLVSVLWGDWEDPFNTFADYTRNVKADTSILLLNLGKSMTGETVPPAIKKISFEPSFSINMPLNDTTKISFEPTLHVNYSLSEDVIFALGTTLKENSLQSIAASFDGKWNSLLGIKIIKPTLLLNYQYSVDTSSRGTASFSISPGIISTLIDAKIFSLALSLTPTFFWTPEELTIPMTLAIKPAFKIGNATLYFLGEGKGTPFDDSLSLSLTFTPAIEFESKYLSSFGINVSVSNSNDSTYFSPAIKCSLGESPTTFLLSCRIPQSMNSFEPCLTVRLKL